MYSYELYSEEANESSTTPQPPPPPTPTKPPPATPPTTTEKPKTAPKPVRTRTDPIRPARRSDTVPIKPRPTGRPVGGEPVKPSSRRGQPSSVASRAGPVRPVAARTVGNGRGQPSSRPTRPSGVSGPSKPEPKEKPAGLAARKGSWHDHISPHTRVEEVAAGGQFQDLVSCAVDLGGLTAILTSSMSAILTQHSSKNLCSSTRRADRKTITNNNPVTDIRAIYA